MIAEEAQIPLYHQVFSSLLANYFNLKKEIDAGVNRDLANERKKEVLSLLRSAYGYAVQLKRNTPENIKIPKEPEKLVKHIDERIEYYKKNSSDYIEAFFFETTQKMELAGLTANYTQTGSSFLEMALIQEQRERVNK
ncbi:MAG: hypothetical protein ABIK73_07235 [candidate division WOR-3 bacterium]